MVYWQVPVAEDPPTWLAALRPPSSGEAQGDSLWETIEVLRSFEAFVLSFLFKVPNLKLARTVWWLLCVCICPLWEEDFVSPISLPSVSWFPGLQLQDVAGSRRG